MQLARCLRTRWLALSLALCALWPASALAHSVGLSKGEYRASAQGLEVELVFARADLLGALPALDLDRDGTLTRSELERGRPLLEAFARRALEVSSEGAACASILRGSALTEADGALLSLRYRCERPVSEFGVRLRFLSELGFAHRHFARRVSGAVVEDAVYFADHASFSVKSAPATPLTAHSKASLLTRASAFVRMGIEHIGTGYDHLAFLFALLLVAASFRSLALVVSAFTLAHSLTFAVVMLGWFAPPAWLTEPLIALSVAYVGFENLFGHLDRRWRITFPFGLVHGFGFANALTQSQIPRADVPLALVSFNLGVELGQLAILLCCAPLVFYLRKHAWYAKSAVPACSAAVVVAGLVWFVARLGGASL